MQGKNIARRRGTSVAAAALSFALVAPFAQPVAAPQFAAAAYAGTPAEAGQPNDAGNGVKYPGKNADGVYQSVVDEQRYTFTDQPIKVEGAIESKGEKNTTESIEGYVIHQRDGDLSVYPGTRDPWQPIPMEGVRVYAQWTEKGGIISPVYTTTTNADGYYSIKMKPFNNAKGEVVKFDADPNGPQYEKIRVWVDNPDTDNFTQLYGYNFGHMGPNGNTYDTPGGMGWGVGPDRVSNVRFAFGEKTRHDIMHLDKADQNPVVGNGPGQIQGKLFWHLYHTQGAFTPNLMNQMNGADVPATGVKVYGSYLSDYAVNQINEKAANDLGFDEIRGSGWTNRNETALQNWIKRKMAEEGKDKWIAETAEATVDSDGNYTLQFRGSFGRGRTSGNVDRGYDDGALIYTDLARDNGAEVIFPDGTKHNAYNLFGQVAPTADTGSWVRAVTGRGIKNIPKHVNWDWLFFSTEKTEGLGQFTPFYNNSFLPRSQYVFNGAGKWAGGMVYGAGEHYLLENRHVIYSDYVVFDVLDYDTRKNPAKPGAKVETKTAGLPGKWVDGLQYQIEWVNQETGKVEKTCDPVDPQPSGTIPSCQLDTAGVESTTTFTAYLYPVNKETGERGQAIAADAFTVLVGWQPHYEETPAKPGEPATSKAPTFDNTETDDVEKLSAEKLKAQDATKEPTKFALPETFEVPEGYTVNVDESTGEVSVTFPKDAANKDSIEVPVQVTYKDGTTATGTARFVVKSTDRHSDKIEPEYKPGNGQPGEDAKVGAPEFKEADENGEPSDKGAEKPDGTTFAPDESKKPTYTDKDGNQKDLPKNDPKVDVNTGEITVTVPKDAQPGTDITVPVVVKYPDTSTDKVDATVKVGEPVPNADEFEPKYTDKTGKPGDDVKVDAPKFKDGEGNDTEAPEGTKFTPGQDAPNGVTVDENTGEISFTIPNDKKPGDKIEVPVRVTYPDGSTDDVTVTVTVEEPAKKPDWKDSETTPGTPVDIEKTEDSGDFEPGTTVEVTEGPGTATIDDNGKITVTPKDEAKPGDKIVVVVKDPEGNEIDRVEVEIKETPKSDADKYDPKGKDQPVKVGEKPDPKKNIQNVGDLPEDTKYEYEGGTPDTSKPGEYDVTVIVTYPDGSTDKVDTKVIVGTDAERFVPKYDEKTYVPVDGDKDTNDPFGKKAPVKDVVVTPTKESDAEKWTFTPQDNGVINAKAPSMKDVAEKIDTKLPELKSTEAGKRWDKFVEDFTPFARPSVDVNFTYNDDSTNETTAGFDLVGKDGKSLLDPDGDFDGDGKSNRDEIEDGTNPADSDTTPPTVNPIKPGDKTISGKGDRPGEDLTVTIPDGKGGTIDIPVTTDENGNWKVEVPSDVDLKTGDKVTVTDGAGNSTEAKVGIDTGKCVATTLGFGLPLIALLPIGLATQMDIPGVTPIATEVSARLEQANSQIQQQLGIFNPQMAGQVAEINARLKEVGGDLSMVAAGIALIAAGILAGTLIYDNCSPNGGFNSSVKDLELKGSSGKTHKLSSKKDDQKNQDQAGEESAPETEEN